MTNATPPDAQDTPTAADEAASDVFTDTRWQKSGWVAQVIKNEDDDGWAVAMTRVGDAEPALVGPWTMGRDKKNPKPLNPKDFSTLVKTANEVLERAHSAQHAALHKSTTLFHDDRRVRVDLDIATDEDDPHAVLKATDENSGEVLGEKRVAPNFKLSLTSAQTFVSSLS
jgi:hypothetical protein